MTKTKSFKTYKELFNSQYMTRDPLVLEDTYLFITPVTLTVRLNETTFKFQNISEVSIDDRNESDTDDKEDLIICYMMQMGSEEEITITYNSQNNLSFEIENPPLTNVAEMMEHRMYIDLSYDLFMAETLEEYRKAIERYKQKLNGLISDNNASERN